MAHIYHSINPNHILEHVCMSNLHQARIIQTHTDYTETRNFGDWLTYDVGRIFRKITLYVIHADE